MVSKTNKKYFDADSDAQLEFIDRTDPKVDGKRRVKFDAKGSKGRPGAKFPDKLLDNPKFKGKDVKAAL